MTVAADTNASLLADFTSRDPHRIWSASWAVVKTRDAAVLSFLAPRRDEIAAATDGVELGGMFASNARALRAALWKLGQHAAGAPCTCGVYELAGVDPAHEQRDGRARILDTQVIPWASRFVVACTACGARYDVQEETAHITTYDWKVQSPAPSS